MEAFETLRQQARQKRDEAIIAARIEYHQTVQRIESLEHQLAKHGPKSRRGECKPVHQAILDSALDRPFTTDEIIARMEQAEPGRKFNIATVRTIMRELVQKGKLHRVRRTHNGVVWGAVGCAEPVARWGTKNMPDVVAEVLAETGPLKLAELLVTVRERGYRTDLKPHSMLSTLGSALKLNPRRFKRVDGRWGLV